MNAPVTVKPYEAWILENGKPLRLGRGESRGECNRMLYAYRFGVIAKGSEVLAVKGRDATSERALRLAIKRAWREQGGTVPPPLAPEVPPPPPPVRRAPDEDEEDEDGEPADSLTDEEQEELLDEQSAPTARPPLAPVLTPAFPREPIAPAPAPPLPEPEVEEPTAATPDASPAPEPPAEPTTIETEEDPEETEETEPMKETCVFPGCTDARCWAEDRAYATLCTLHKKRAMVRRSETRRKEGRELTPAQAVRAICERAGKVPPAPVAPSPAPEPQPREEASSRCAAPGCAEAQGMIRANTQRELATLCPRHRKLVADRARSSSSPLKTEVRRLLREASPESPREPAQRVAARPPRPRQAPEATSARPGGAPATAHDPIATQVTLSVAVTLDEVLPADHPARRALACASEIGGIAVLEQLVTLRADSPLADVARVLAALPRSAA